MECAVIAADRRVLLWDDMDGGGQHELKCMGLLLFALPGHCR